MVYWHRIMSKKATCSDALAAPTGADLVEDAVFAAAMVTAPATATMVLGEGTSTFSLSSGVNTMKM